MGRRLGPGAGTAVDATASGVDVRGKCPTYTVGPGESCMTVRAHVEAAGLRYDHAAMQAANEGVDLNILEPGQVLQLPNEWGAAVGSPVQAEQPAAPQTGSAPFPAPTTRVESWAQWAYDRAHNVGDAVSAQAASAQERAWAWWQGHSSAGEQQEGGAAEDGVPDRSEGWADAIRVDTLGAAEGYVDSIDRYGFAQTGELKGDHADKRAAMDELWCSGLSTATLLDVGVPLDAPIEGQFYYENGEKKPLTMRMLVEGMPEALASTEELGRTLDGIEATADDYAVYANNSSLTESEKWSYAKMRAVSREMYAAVDFGEDVTGEEADLRVQGAAGAFVLAGIGTAIRDHSKVRPGDFAQRRDVNSADGHAWQLHDVVAEGDAIFGLPGSPELLEARSEGTAEDGGTRHTMARFRLGPTTNPNTVMSASAIQWEVIESNVKGATSAASKVRTGPENDPDKYVKKNGGVTIRATADIPSAEDHQRSDDQLYIGRLNTSPWAGQS